MKTASCAILVILCMSPALTGESKGRAKKVAKPDQQVKPTSAAISGRAVYKDPETGLLGPPEKAALTPQVRSQARIAPPTITRLPQGGVARQTPLSELKFAVVQRNADGSLSYSHKRGLASAEDLVKQSTAPKTAEGALQ